MSAIRATCSEVSGLTHRSYHSAPSFRHITSSSIPVSTKKPRPLSLAHSLQVFRFLQILVFLQPDPAAVRHHSPALPFHLKYQFYSAKVLHTYLTRYAAVSRKLPTLHPSTPQASKPRSPRHSISSRRGSVFPTELSDQSC